MNSYTQALDTDRKYRNVFIVESRDWWSQCVDGFDPSLDVVFTYDFGLRRDVERAGGAAHYVDHVVEPDVMEQNNHLVYEFLRAWHRDEEGNDLFVFRGVPFGFTFRIDIWNDLIFRVRMHLCLQRIVALDYARIFVGASLGVIEDILHRMQVPFVSLPQATARQAVYFFPIHRWMDEKIRSSKLKHKIKPLVAAVFGIARSLFKPLGRQKVGIFVQEYYPTREILRRLQQDPDVQVVLARYSAGASFSKLFSEHAIPVYGRRGRFRAEAARIMRRFKEHRCSKLVLTTGADVTDDLFAVFERRVSDELVDALRTLDCIIRYIERTPISLEVMISNIGRVQTLVNSVCKAKGVQSYLIINGLLAHSYLDEGKYADVINSYSTAIKEHYFRGMSNVVCLGDPRMDAYAKGPRRSVNRKTPTVTIGASGHNVTSLGSYVAVEFEFLHDVLAALDSVRARGIDVRVIIKVRDNGYLHQYEAFVREFFPGTVQDILQSTPMKEVLHRTDVYVSIYSQTLFEASCLGIPSIYYKKDTETLQPPFDGMSELVTVGTVDALADALIGFTEGDPRFDSFLQPSTMERYIGFLDGNNVERNLKFIYDVLSARAAGERA